MDMGRAMQMLKMSRKGYLTESARRKKDLEKEKEKISANMEYIRREIRELDENYKFDPDALNDEGGKIVQKMVKRLLTYDF